MAALPAYPEVRAAWQASDLYLLDRHHDRLQEIRVDPTQRRTDWTPLEAVSPALIAAVLHAEDQRFFQHGGVDWLAAGRAALTNWLAPRPRGASTLSMQLVALLDSGYRARNSRRGVAEKWDQMQAARDLENTWQKAHILEAYFNLVPFRGELIGIDAAARGFFDKRPAGLSHTEALILAALIRAPNAAPATVAKRVCALAADLPGQPDCKSLTALTRNALSGRTPIAPAANLAPHLGVRLLPSPSGGGAGGEGAASARPRTQFPHPGHLPGGEGKPFSHIHTTLDATLQRQVIATLEDQLRHIAGREVHDAAALVLDNASGEVLAYASISSRDSSSPQSDGVRARRQAGSTLKPFLYGLALEQRLLTAASPLEDVPLSLATGGGNYAPENYDHMSRGLVSVRMALAGSLNIPAVRTAKLTGLEPYAARLARFGFGGLSEDADFYGYALALGSLDVTLEELTNAYRALANGGVWSPLKFLSPSPAGGRYRRVGASSGARGEGKAHEKTAPPRRVLSREASFLINDILSDRQARATTFGLENPLATRFWTAVKTGTSKDMRDNWCIGFSSRHTVGVWVGNFAGTPMHDVSGISGAAPAWAAIMHSLHADTPSNPPAPPRGLLRKRIQPPGEPLRREWFLPGTEPAAHTWTAATPPAEILNPDDGAILALDPDLPIDRQRLTLQASHTPAAAWWQIDGQRLSQPDWPLQRGRHILLLKTDNERELDRVEFEVR